MNKRFTHVLFAFALILGLFIQGQAQSLGQGGDDGRGQSTTNDDSRPRDNLGRGGGDGRPADFRNRLAPLVDFREPLGARLRDLNNIAGDLSDALGIERTLFLASAELGKPIDLMTSDFQLANINVGDFVTAEILAHDAGVPVTEVVDLIRTDQDMIDVFVELDLSPKQTIDHLENFIEICDMELNASGDINIVIQIFLDTLNRTDNRFDALAIRLGNDVFNALLTERLSMETGLSLLEINNLRSTLNTLTPSQFAVSLLVTNTVSAVLPSNPVTITGTTGALFQSDTILTTLSANNIPVSVMTSRLSLLNRRVGSLTGLR